VPARGEFFCGRIAFFSWLKIRFRHQKSFFLRPSDRKISLLLLLKALLYTVVSAYSF